MQETKEEAYIREQKALFKKYGIKKIRTEYGYYDEQTPYVVVEGGKKKIDLPDLV